MTVYAITDTKKGEQGLRLLIFKLGPEQPERPEQLLVTPVVITLSECDYSPLPLFLDTLYCTVLLSEF